jgi:NADH-quinone oxidoreductase subunit L
VLGIGAATVGFINMAPVEKVTGTHLTFLKDWLKIGTVGEESAFAVLSSEHYHHVLFADYGAGYAAADLSPVIPAVVSLGLALAGVGAAWALYSDPDPSPQTTKLGSVRTLLMNNYYQDEFQVWLAKGVTVPVAQAADTFDQSIVDGVVNGVGSVSLFSGERFRRIQTGVVSNYATLLTLGLTLLLVVFGLVGGWF